MSAGSAAVTRALVDAVLAEKEQALFYRALAALAETREDAELSQRFHDLHADEQHHLSRLSARLLELGERPPALDAVRAAPVPLEEWEPETRRREAAEVARYTALAALELDDHTRALIEEILDVERHHASELGGKWTPA
jgi:rubrerythrin